MVMYRRFFICVSVTNKVQNIIDLPWYKKEAKKRSTIWNPQYLRGQICGALFMFCIFLFLRKKHSETPIQYKFSGNFLTGRV